ncbi:hypothetical protein PHPALM_31250, partial [Phytophthora palmivora]
ITIEDHNHMNKLLATWIECHIRPMAVVEDDGFVEFVRYITEDLGHMKSVLSKRTDLIIQLLLIFGLLRTRSYVSFTVHYGDEGFYPKSWTMNLKNSLAYMMEQPLLLR